MLYSAVYESSLAYRFVDRSTRRPVRQGFLNDKGEEVDDERVAYKYLIDDEIVALTDEDIQRALPEHALTVRIVHIIPANLIDPVLYDEQYYVVPEALGEKRYFLFCEILQRTAQEAIGTIFLNGRERLCALSAYRLGFRLATLRYAHEVRSMLTMPNLHGRSPFSPEELILAEQLVGKLASEEFDIKEYKDATHERIRTARKPRRRRRVRRHEKSLIDELRESL